EWQNSSGTVLANTGAVIVNGGTLQLNDTTETVGAVTLTSGSITVGTTGNILTGTSYTINPGTGVTVSVSANLAGAVNLTHSGAGTANLSGYNAYSGTTTLNTSGGILAITGSGTQTDADSGGYDVLFLDSSVIGGLTATAPSRGIAKVVAQVAPHGDFNAIVVNYIGYEVGTEAVARDMGFVIKLLAIAELTKDNEISVRVHPTLISRRHPLASVRLAFNAVFIEAQSAGELMFYGRGAGGEPTASAILGDLIAIARNKVRGGQGHGESDYADLAIAPIDNVKSQYLIRLDVADKPGVLANVAQLFAANSVSIETVRQTGRGDSAELIVATHYAPELALKKTVKSLADS
ncbi:MAG: ACT domain-containing protein, partial [Actinobacteria bacterium]|nr:ACT domain-containing protein [Actinomycetota bacterium]